MQTKQVITVAYGDGIGPEIMTAVLKILEAAKADIVPEKIEVGEKVYLAGNTTGISEDAWNSLRRTKVLLKAPITTPQGGGYKSLNVTIRKAMGLYANIRPCRAYHPFVSTHFPKMDLVVVRENEEDLYAGIEYRQTNDVYQCLKLISHTGSEKIIRYAFEYAQQFNRKKVTCMIKDNIMKMTDGVFHDVFKEIAKEYPQIESTSMIIDIGTARVADTPEDFDVIVTENLYGDIISDVTAQVAGSVGLAGSSNVGDHIAMFEAIHGSAPDIAGKDIANPSGLLNGAIMMLVHLNQPEIATLIENAWLTTLEEGIHTADIYQAGISQQKVGTQGFADAVIERLGKQPKQFKSANYSASSSSALQKKEKPPARIAEKVLVGVDLFLDLPICGPAQVAELFKNIIGRLQLKVISNRGIKVWPEGQSETYCSDHWRCRFVADEQYSMITHQHILELLSQTTTLNIDVIKTENLYLFDGKKGFTLSQGE